MPKPLKGLDLLETMNDHTIAIKHFTSLNRAPGPIWTEATKRKAPHKPLLLLLCWTWCKVNAESAPDMRHLS